MPPMSDGRQFSRGPQNCLPAGHVSSGREMGVGYRRGALPEASGLAGLSCSQWRRRPPKPAIIHSDRRLLQSRERGPLAPEPDADSANLDSCSRRGVPRGRLVPRAATAQRCLTPIPSPNATRSVCVPVACFVSETASFCFVPDAVVMKSPVRFRPHGEATNYFGAVLRRARLAPRSLEHTFGSATSKVTLTVTGERSKRSGPARGAPDYVAQLAAATIE